MDVKNLDVMQEITLPGAPITADQFAFYFDHAPVGPGDVENCYAIILGRRSDRDCQVWLGVGMSQLLRELVESEEFKTSVLPPLLLREELPHTLLDVAPSLSLIDWAQRRLPMGASTRLSIGAARTWAQLLELLLSDATLAATSAQLAEADVQLILRTRLEKEPFFKVKRSVVGAVDSSSAFEVRGWAVDVCDKSTPVILEFYSDGTFIGTVACTESRPDVRDVVGGSGNCGFTFKIANAHRAGFAGERTLTVIDSVSKAQIGRSIVVHSDATHSWDVIGQTRRELIELRKILDRIEARLPEIGRTASVPMEAYGEYWERFYRLSPEIVHEQRIRSSQFNYRPLISIVVPTWNSNTLFLHKAIESVRAQSYDRWEIVISNDASDRDELRSLLRRYADDPRIRWTEGTTREGIAVNTNRGISVSVGDYIAFLDHDDELSPDALYQVARQLQEHRYGLLYSDEDRIEDDEFGRCVHHTPFFKPGFDPDLLLAMNYICHLVVVRREIIVSVGGLRSGYEGAQDHDLLLRLVERLPEQDIAHLPRVLYHWRVTPGSLSRTPQLAEEIQRNIIAVVDSHLQRRMFPAKAETHNDPVGPARQFATRIRWSLPAAPPKLSIIVATRDRLDLLRPCIQSVLDSIAIYPGRSEILLVDNDSTEPAVLDYFAHLAAHPQVRVTRFRGPFNWSAINNAAAREAFGEVLIFLNNDTIVLTKDWCVELAANAMRPEVGAVGARLLYADGTIQHAGVLLGIEGVAGHECVGETPESGGYFGRSQLLRSASAVTGACLATRRGLFEAMDGGFDELELKVAFNDVDYCMKLRRAGYRVVYNPFAVLYHLESKSRGREISQAQQARHRSEALAFRTRWSETEMVDPYFNFHFERFARPFERLRPPPEVSAAWETHRPAVAAGAGESTTETRGSNH
jgi:O-antigen biosynthesis protein